MSYEEEFDKIISQKTETGNYPFDEANWEKARQMIDAGRAPLVAAKAGKMPAILTIALGTLGLISLLYFNQSTTLQPSQSFKNETTTADLNENEVLSTPVQAERELTVKTVEKSKEDLAPTKEILAVETKSGEETKTENRVLLSNLQKVSENKDVTVAKRDQINNKANNLSTNNYVSQEGANDKTENENVSNSASSNKDGISSNTGATGTEDKVQQKEGKAGLGLNPDNSVPKPKVRRTGWRCWGAAPTLRRRSALRNRWC